MTDRVHAEDAWNEIAPGYDEFVTPSNQNLAEGALERAGLRPGMRVLDVAAGSGALGIPAARGGAEVVATDIAPEMVDHLAARARAEGLPDLEARVMDGQALDLEDDTFDLAGSQFGFMLFPDLPRGAEGPPAAFEAAQRDLFDAVGLDVREGLAAIPEVRLVTAPTGHVPCFTESERCAALTRET